MNTPIELFYRAGAEGDPLRGAGWMCERCRNYFSNREQAANCCVPPVCGGCGKECGNFMGFCLDCQQGHAEAERVEAMSRAIKLDAWDGWVYAEGVGKEFFEGIDQLAEYVSRDGYAGPRPEFAIVCEPKPFASVEIRDIYDVIMGREDAYEDFEPDAQLEGQDDLVAALDAFNEKNKDVVSRVPDPNRAIRVPTREEYLASRAALTAANAAIVASDTSDPR